MIERLRLSWENLSEREQRLSLLMGGVLLVMMLTLPLYLLLTTNSDLQAENDELRDALAELADKRVSLQQAATQRRSALARYDNKTPALGSFIEAEARKQGLDLKEVVDQPERSVGTYHRRNARASMPGVGLSPVINLMSSIVQSGHPVAIDHIEVDHHNPGNLYNVKIGVLTFDKQGAKASADETGDGDGDDDDDGNDDAPEDE